MVLGLPQLLANVTRESSRLRPTMLWSGEQSPFLESEELESGKGKKEVEAKHVSYSYTFFYMVFALASR
ncbi:hypothetical protein Hanom_Chr02g00150811 [Helianthus anomalus]